MNEYNDLTTQIFQNFLNFGLLFIRQTDNSADSPFFYSPYCFDMPASERFPRWKKITYGIGGFAENFFHNALNIMATPFLNIGFGVSPALVSLAMTIPRIWDAFTDPFMGAISDRFRSRFGRRRPFIFVGGLATAATFAGIWWIPAGGSEMATFWMFLGMLMLYYTFFTVFIVPYLALGFELTPDYDERTRIMSYKSFFSVAAGFAMNWLYWLTQREVFDGIVEGMRWVGIGCGLVLAMAAIVPAVFLRERLIDKLPDPVKDPTVKAKKEGYGVIASVKAALSRKPFLLVVATCVSVIIGVLSIMQIGMYLNIYYVSSGDQKLASTIQGIAGSCYQVTSILAVPLVSWLGTRFGKRKALMGILSLGVLGSLSAWFLVTPVMPYLQIASLFLTAPAISGLWILAPSMIADVCDYDEDLSGKRREGMFGAAYGWFTKVGGSAALLTSGFVLTWTGFDVGLGAAQTDETIYLMRGLNAFVPAFFFSVAIFCIHKYPISAKVAEAIRERIEAKR